MERLSEGDYLEGRYRIVRQIGEGGMGVVYEAEHVLLKRKCAVKVLHPAEADDKSMIARFKVEARSSANIRHPNIVEVMDFGLTPDNRPFFVMEFLTGESLAAKLDRVGRFATGEAVEVADSILSGLVVAHRSGIIHRDLKPENILLSRGDDKRVTVKILDFGISKIIGGTPSVAPPPITGDNPKLTQAGIVLGTPGYMAPETLFGAMEVDSRADLFSVGVLLFEMLTGRRPFRGADAHEIMVATASKPVPRPRSLRPDISEAMERLLLSALAKDPDDRIRTAQDFLTDLAAAAVGRVPSDAPPVKTRVGVPSIMPGAQQHVAPTEQAATAPPPRLSVPKKKMLTPPPDVPEASVPQSDSWVPGARKTSGTILPRRFSIKISPGYFIFLVVLGAAVYYFFYYQEPMMVASQMDPIDERIRDLRTRGPRSSADQGNAQTDKAERQLTADGTPLPAVVTIWLDTSPSAVTATWDGTVLPERPLVVPGSTIPVELKVSAPGYHEEQRMITPDREYTVRIKLKKIKKKRKSR